MYLEIMALEGKFSTFLNNRKWVIPVLFIMMCLYFVGTIACLEIKHFDNIQSNFAFSIGGELCAMAVAIVLTLSILPAYKRQSGYIRIFATLLTVGCSCCFFDSLQMLVDGIPELIWANKAICILVFINESVFVFFFWLYVTYVLNSRGRKIEILSMIINVGLLIFVLLPFVNIFYPLYFSIDPETGLYARNPSTWWICRIFIVLIGIVVLIAIHLSKAKLKTRIVIIVFMFLPFIAVGAGGYKYGVSLLYTAMMVSLVMMYSFLYSENEKTLFSKNKELGLANNIQKHMLPSIFPAFPELKEFDIYALMNPAKEVGGDFYDFFLVDDTHLALVMADVSDKGVPAALFMMASKIMIQNFTLMGFSPKEVITKANQQICMTNQDEMFVTVWLGILDLETGLLTACNAGHERPIIKKPNGEFEVFKDKHGFIVGSFKEAQYEDYQIQLERGSKIFLYTDGVPEARNHVEQFGFPRTLKSLNKNKDKSPHDICTNLVDDLEKFIGTENQFDDITMLCLEYRGKNHECSSITVQAERGNISRAIFPISELLKKHEIEHKVIYKIEVALEEVLTNVASYAYEDKIGDMTIEYDVIDSPRTLVVKVIDSGKEFNPLEIKEPDLDTPIEERPIGGLGIFIVKKTMDEMEYVRKDGKNILIMKKAI